MNIIHKILYYLLGLSHLDRLESKLHSLVADAEATAAQHLKEAEQAAEHLKIIADAQYRAAVRSSKAQAVATAAKQIVDEVI